jgi:L-threonylcarbamoyladenylate synthase
MVIVTHSNELKLQEAARILAAGGLVAMPTETVYGLAANAFDGQAVARVYAAKGRPEFNPLIVHCRDQAHAARYAVFDERAQILAHHFWPGPLTLVLPRMAATPISSLATAGLDTIALRVPAHAVAQKLLRLLDFPLVAPSANKSGMLSPTTPQHVAHSLGSEVDMILAAGPTELGLESTVIDLSTDHAILLRAGMIDADDIARILQQPVHANTDNNVAPKSPGQLLQHYAPRAPVRLRAVDIEAGEALLAFGSTRFMGIRHGGSIQDLPETHLRNLSETGDLTEAAANLFADLHRLDSAHPTRIAVMDIPQVGLGIAINDRLRRAAAS